MPELPQTAPDQRSQEGRQLNGFGQRYVIDTNALSQIGRRRRSTSFFLDNAVVPSEVVREAEGFPDIDVLRKNLHPTTAQVLEWLVQVLATVPAEDTSLVNLYANLGGADPLLVECALDGRTRDSPYLDAPEWVIVTGDDAVRVKAEEFGLNVLSNAEFAAVIDATESPDYDQGFDASDVSRGQDADYRSCSECDGDCSPEPFKDANGFRIAFVCREHGIQSVVDPFKDSN